MRAYRYSDTPDGEDLVKKAIILTKNIGWLFSIYGLHDVAFVTRPKTYLAMTDRFFRILLPPIGAGLTFVTYVHIAANVRKKDDEWNHLWGAFAGATFLRKCNKRMPFFWYAAFPSILLVGLCKHMCLEGFYMYDLGDADYMENIQSSPIDWYMTPKSAYKTWDYLYSDEFN